MQSLKVAISIIVYTVTNYVINSRCFVWSGKPYHPISAVVNFFLPIIFVAWLILLVIPSVNTAAQILNFQCAGSG